jgi:hypothetical protein
MTKEEATASAALKLALEAWKNVAIRLGEELSSVGPDGYYDMTAQQWLDWAMEQEPRGKNSLAQPEQEPVAINQHRIPYCADWYDGIPDHHDGHGPYEVRTLYTTPPKEQRSCDKRPWVGLTDEEMDKWIEEEHDVLRWAEVKLKEKNT